MSKATLLWTLAYELNDDEGNWVRLLPGQYHEMDMSVPRFYTTRKQAREAKKQSNIDGRSRVERLVVIRCCIIEVGESELA